MIRAPIDVEELARLEEVAVQRVSADDDISGILHVEQGNAIIGVNAAHHPNRQRFTIAHELGHLTLHVGNKRDELFIDENLVYFRDGKSTDIRDQKEIEANRFAAALLMPKKLLSNALDDLIDINDDLTIRRLARRFQVSVQALTVRLTNLGYLRGIEP